MPDLALQGHFHLPNQPDQQVPGILTFSTTEGGTLTLIGELPPSDTEQSRVIGQTPGNIYTLEDCFETFGDRSKGKQVLRVQRLVVGAAYAKDQPITADQASIQLASLTHWIQSAGYGDTIQSDDRAERHSRWTITSDPIEPLTISIPQGTLRLGQGRGMTGDGITSRTLTQTAGFHLRFNNTLPLDDVIDLASDLQDLVSIGTDRPATFERFLLWHPDPQHELPDEPAASEPVEYLAQWRAQPSDHKHPPSEYDMAFTFRQLGGIDAIATWLDVAAKYRTMLGTVMSTSYADRMFVNDRLLERMAALEGFHRVRTGMDAPVLQSRLPDLTDLAGAPFEQLVGNVVAWRRRAAAERNNIAHHQGRFVHGSSGEMYVTAEAAYWLFVVCLLREMQAPQPVFDHLVRCPRFLWAKKRLTAGP
jgi:hypothetical protein